MCSYHRFYIVFSFSLTHSSFRPELMCIFSFCIHILSFTLFSFYLFTYLLLCTHSSFRPELFSSFRPVLIFRFVSTFMISVLSSFPPVFTFLFSSYFPIIHYVQHLFFLFDLYSFSIFSSCISRSSFGCQLTRNSGHNTFYIVYKTYSKVNSLSQNTEDIQLTVSHPLILTGAVLQTQHF